MQGDELRTVRGEMRMTQGEFAEALGLTPTFIGMMERGDRPIEKRTELAARQLYNERLPLYGGWDVEELDGDVPLADAMIIWDNDDPALHPRIKVLFHGNGDDQRYSSSFGACNSDWIHADTIGRLLRLFSRFPEWTMLEGLSPKEVHDALWVIPEYRASVCHQFALDKEREADA